MKTTPMQDFQIAVLRVGLRLSGGNVVKAAQIVGIGHATAYRWITRYRIDLSDFEQKETTVTNDSDPPRKSGYDLTQKDDRRKVDVGSLDFEELRREITESPVPLSTAARIAARAGVAAEHQEFMTEMAIRGLELLVKGAKKAAGLVVLAAALAGCSSPQLYFSAYSDPNVLVVSVAQSDGIKLVAIPTDPNNHPAYRIITGPVSELQTLLKAQGIDFKE